MLAAAKAKATKKIFLYIFPAMKYAQNLTLFEYIKNPIRI